MRILSTRRDSSQAHEFHIPVMGTGYTIDTPMKVAHLGLSSVISLVDDTLIEQAREHYCELHGEPYSEITEDDDDARARRITAYLNLVHRIVTANFEALRDSSFDDEAGIRRYLELLPDGHALRDLHAEMLASPDGARREAMQEELRAQIVPGAVDVNVMTKLDRGQDRRGRALEDDRTDALAAFRGFANSDLPGAMVLSAGMNPRLFNIIADHDDFRPDADGEFAKRLILKVSDFRSAKIQGKYLAKRGVWISEYNLESGLNCGGHAFATAGALMGPILEEFQTQRGALHTELLGIYYKALAEQGHRIPDRDPGLTVTAQGGVGNHGEHAFLRERYGVDSVGWASPFLLVPEVTAVDDATLRRLADAAAEDLQLSWASPLGVRFWNLMTCDAEVARKDRLAAGKPGSKCPKGYLMLNTEFGEQALCVASRGYKRRKLQALDAVEPVHPDGLRLLRERTVSATCICHELGGGFKIKEGIEHDSTASICPGPNVVYFSKIASLEEMVGHIYGRENLLAGVERSHVFINELRLYVSYVREQIDLLDTDVGTLKERQLVKTIDALQQGIDYYRELAAEQGPRLGERFLADLEELATSLTDMADLSARAPLGPHTPLVQVHAGQSLPA